MNLYNSTFKRSTPLKRTKALAHKAALKSGAKRLRSRGPKMTPIRASAKNEDCTMNLPGVCKQEPGNVVWAHSNDAQHGKGGALKAEDQYGCYACYWCHMVYDGQAPRPAGLTKEQVDAAFYIGMYRSREILRRKGLLRELA